MRRHALRHELRGELMLQFGKREPEASAGRRRRPPNFLSRRSERQLLYLLGLFVLVLILMHEARQPKHWTWLWSFQNAASRRDAASDEKIDTRLRSPLLQSDAGQPRDLLVAPGEREGVSPTVDARRSVSPAGSRPAARLSTAAPPAADDAWSQLLQDLDGDSRQLLFRLLKAVRDGQAPTEDDRAAWPGILAELETGWENYLERLRSETETDDARWADEERQSRRRATDELQQQWDEHWKPALQILAAASPPSPEVRQSLDDLQRTLDAVFLKAVRDNTVFTDSEKDAWFRLFERLQQADLSWLEGESRGEIAFAQLYREPDAYRGQLVTVRGTVRLGYYRQAPRNLYGIGGYYLFWLRPVGSTNPIVVYSLEVPEGFPDVRALEAQGRKPELFEDVQFTGYFFKRWAYRAEDGTRLAPLVLAKCPRWEPPLGGTGRVPGERPGLPALALGVLAAVLFAVVFVVTVYRLGRRPSAAAASPAATDAELEKRLSELAQK
jgi:hypothetical protein